MDSIITNKEERYYYVSYGKYLSTYSSLTRSQWQFGGQVIDDSPLEWIINKNLDSLDIIYVLISWNEITKEEYEKFKNKFN
jgi:hypothetical protein